MTVYEPTIMNNNSTDGPEMIKNAMREQQNQHQRQHEQQQQTHRHHTTATTDCFVGNLMSGDLITLGGPEAPRPRSPSGKSIVKHKWTPMIDKDPDGIFMDLSLSIRVTSFESVLGIRPCDCQA